MDLSIAAVFGAGLLTFLSPCVLPLVPVYLSILAGDTGEGPASRFRALAATALFVLGFGIVFSAMGLSATVVGRAMIRHKLLFQQLGGIVVLLLGLRFLGWLKVPFLENAGGAGLARFKTRSHYVNSLVLGLLFAFAFTPCIGSVLGAVLTYTSLKTTDPWAGVGYLGAYSLGFGLPLLAVAAVAGPALNALKKARRFLPVFERVTGGLLVATGLLLATDQMGLLNFAMARDPLPAAEVRDVMPDLGAEFPPADHKAPPLSPLHLKDLAAGGPVAGATCGAEGGATPAGQCGVPDAKPSRPRIIEFYAPNCPICLQMLPIVNTLRNDCRSKDVDVRLVDVSTPEGRALAREYGVSGIPVFVFLDPAGKEAARLVGYQTLQQLQQASAVLIGEQCTGYRPIDP